MAAPMQFWGVEVKSKEPRQVSLEDSTLIHVSQITLGELKKDTDTVIVHVKVGNQKLVLGMLSNKTPQVSVDLVFDEDFEISHNWKNGSVHLVGYQTEIDDGESFDGFSDEEDDVPVPVHKEEVAKAGSGKPKVKEEVKPKTEEEDDSDDDDSSEDEDSEDEDSDVMTNMGDSDEDSDDSGEEDDSEDSEDEKPAKVDNSVKRPNADSKTPSNKKAKITTPQKTDAKKGVVHPATPHPAKKGSQTPGSNKSPNSGGGKSPKSFGNNKSTGPSKNKFKPGSGSQKKGKHGK